MLDGDPGGRVERAENDLVLSFLRVRRAIGLLGYFLPPALLAYSLIWGDGLLPSISAYYYSPMREVFVGILSAIAVFLWSYEGYRPRPGEWLSDLMAGRAASLGALAVALIPTAPGQPVACTLSQCVLGFPLASTVHWLSVQGTSVPGSVGTSAMVSAPSDAVRAAARSLIHSPVRGR